MVKPAPDLERRMKEGSIYEGETRVITFRASTFQSIIEKVEDMAGDVVARTIFYQIGVEIGRRSFEYSKDEEITFDNFVNVLDGILSERGWGRFTSLNKTASSREVIYECTFQDCIMCYARKATKPVCHTIHGIFVAWLEALLDKKAQSSIETECRANGKDSCKFKITFAK